MLLNKQMKALILVGGYGTRLRPLTFTTPKPLVPFANRPMVFHQIRGLAGAGVTEVVLAVNYKAEALEAEARKYEEELDVKISFSLEKEPLGTAGPLALAAETLRAGGEPFFVLNSDIVCSYPFAEMLEFHRKHGGEATIAVTETSEPSKYGVVVYGGAHAVVKRFVEKPAEFISSKINAGLYLLNPSVLARIEVRPTSLETEIFPQIAGAGQMHAFPLEGFWMDIGQSADYLRAVPLYLEHISAARLGSASLATIYHPNEFNPPLHRSKLAGNVLIAPSAKIGENCELGPNTVVGPNVTIGDGVLLKNSVIFEGTVIGSNSVVEGSLVGWNCRIASWARATGGSVLGEGVSVEKGLSLNGAIVLPNKTIKESIHAPQILL